MTGCPSVYPTSHILLKESSRLNAHTCKYFKLWWESIHWKFFLLLVATTALKCRHFFQCCEWLWWTQVISLGLALHQWKVSVDGTFKVSDLIKVTSYSNFEVYEGSQSYLIFKVWIDEGSLLALPPRGVLLLLHLSQDLESLCEYLCNMYHRIWLQFCQTIPSAWPWLW